jgi:alanine dehydrogenase
VEALAAIRPIRRIRLFSPTAANRERFGAELRSRGFEVTVFDEPREVYRGADILAACTDSTRPVIRGEWLEAGMHVVSIGGRPDDAALARFDRKLRLGTSPAPVGRPEMGVADEYLGYLARPQDPRWQKVKGGRKAPNVTGGGEVRYADVREGRARARGSRDEVTYSERGNVQGAQFFAVAGIVFEAARGAGLGRELPTEWFLQDIRN